ncbi:MAG: response regulator [Candidatus Eisenbacteria bacterium]|nr:response regulator [Candidatus Eisenbacteria bacterium]
MKCLVVDDSAITRRILVNNLRLIGFTEILEASEGKQALEMCDSSLRVVLTDWNMPGMPGVELVRSIRANPELASLPVLLITSRNGKEDVVEAANAGINGYIVKPFTPDVLKAKLEELLPRPDATGTDG